MFLLLSGSLTAAFHPAKLFAVYRSHTTRHTFSLLLHGWSQAEHVTWPGLVRLLFSGLKESQGRVAMGSTQGQDGEQEMEFWKIFLKTHGLVVGVVKGLGGRGEEEPKAAIEVTWAARWVVLLFTGVRSPTRLDPFSVTETTKCRLCFLVSVQMFLGPFYSPLKEAREVGLPPGLACVSGVSNMEYLSATAGSAWSSSTWLVSTAWLEPRGKGQNKTTPTTHIRPSWSPFSAAFFSVQWVAHLPLK